MKTFKPLLGSMIAVSAIAAQPAFAQSADSTLAVSATVSNNCVISTTPLDFATVDVTSGNDVDGTGGFSVTCTSGASWTATADAGTGSGATFAARQMTNGTEVMTYALYTDAARSTVWGDATATDIDGVGTGAAQATTIYGRIPSGQSALPSRTYNDTVTVTVTY